MTIPRRQFLQCAAAGAAAVVSGTAWSQSYPSRPVRLVAPFPAGGTVDVYARMMGQALSERLGQSFVIENRAGAGGNLGTEAVVSAPPDGYTLLQVTSSNAWNTTLYEKLSFNFLRHIAPIASIQQSPGILVVHPSFPARSVPELIAYAKANPGKINMASGGVGSAAHVYGELFKMMADVDMLHVP
jgi:tripartite-type tricarboxylate transporter receptor subunit TctC